MRSSSTSRSSRRLAVLHPGGQIDELFAHILCTDVDELQPSEWLQSHRQIVEPLRRNLHLQGGGADLVAAALYRGIGNEPADSLYNAAQLGH